MMKKHMIYMWLLALAMPLLLTSCSDDNDTPNVTPTASGTVKDKDGNEYRWVRIGDLDWMTENARVGTPYFDDMDNDKWTVGYNSLSLEKTYAEEKALYSRFGNYYSWQEAVDNAPEGWRLPTDEDWKNLETTLGMSREDADKENWRSGAKELMMQEGEGTTQLNFCCAGQICYYSWNITTYHRYDYGYYWTATSTEINGEKASYARQITPGYNAVARIKVLHEGHFLSVRYVRDAK